ncbi:MAG: GNAT family N-acetyltransferase [Pseudomonadota bacterium]
MSDPHTIHLEESDSKGRFFMRAGLGRDDPEMTFSKAGDTMIIIDHTHVPESMKGTGVGVKLVTAAVEHARKNKVRIVPLCPFAAAQFRKHPEWHDVLNT